MAYKFNGSQDLHNLNGLTGLDATVKSMSFHVKFDALPSAGNAVAIVALGADNTSANRTFISHLYYDGSTYYLFVFGGWSTQNGNWTAPWPTTPTTGVWYKVAVYYDGSATTNKPFAWIDGTALGALTESQTPIGTLRTGTDSCIIGAADTDFGSARLTGQVDTVGLWGYQLDDAHYLSLSNGYAPDLVRLPDQYFPLIGDTNSIVKAATSLTATGSPTISSQSPVIYPPINPTLFLFQMELKAAFQANAFQHNAFQTGWVANQDRVVTATRAAFTFTKYNPGINKARAADCLPATFTFTKHNPVVDKRRIANATRAAFTFTTHNPSVNKARAATCLPAAFTFTKHNPVVDKGRHASATHAAFTFTAHNPVVTEFSPDLNVHAGVAAFTFAKHNAEIGKARNAQPSVHAFTFTTHNPHVDKGLTVRPNVVAFTFTKYNPIVRHPAAVHATHAAFTFTKHNPAIVRSRTVKAKSRHFTFKTHKAKILPVTYFIWRRTA